jgi:hypothetical protein
MVLRVRRRKAALGDVCAEVAMHNAYDIPWLLVGRHAATKYAEMSSVTSRSDKEHVVSCPGCGIRPPQCW